MNRVRSTLFEHETCARSEPAADQMVTHGPDRQETERLRGRGDPSVCEHQDLESSTIAWEAWWRISATASLRGVPIE